MPCRGVCVCSHVCACLHVHTQNICFDQSSTDVLLQTAFKHFPPYVHSFIYLSPTHSMFCCNCC